MEPLIHNTFHPFLQSNKFALIHFWASWNLTTDPKMKAILETALPPDLQQTIAIATFDIDPPEHHEIYRQIGLRNIPFLAFYPDGRFVKGLTGLCPPEQLIAHLRQLLLG